MFVYSLQLCSTIFINYICVNKYNHDLQKQFKIILHILRDQNNSQNYLGQKENSAFYGNLKTLRQWSLVSQQISPSWDSLSKRG